MASLSAGLRVVGILLLAALAAPAQDDKKEREEAAKKKAEEFKAAIKDLKSPFDKAQLILALGESEVRETPLVAPIAKYLAPSGGDIHYLLPVTAADALAKFRGNAAASQSLIASLPAYKKIPYVHKRLITAIGKVGHESALAIFEEPIRGKDAKAAVDAVEAIAEMPAGVALESLFREYDKLEKKKSNASEEEKTYIAAVQPAMIKAVKSVSGEKYPTMPEQILWWQKRGAAFKEEAAKKEKEALAKRDPAAAKPALPPLMIVELTFKENGGTTTANSGSSSVHFPMASVTNSKPAWNGSAPPNGGPSSLDWVGGGGAVDLKGMIEHLRNLKSFTITGWVNCKNEKETPGDKLAPGGNRLVTWLNHGKDGVELVQRADGSLQLGVNQWADASPAKSQAAQIPVLDDKAKDAAAALRENWRFFAVTYDSGAAAAHVKFYAGTQNADAKAAGVADYSRGPVGGKIGPELSVGNVNGATRPMAPDRCFKGLIDEVRIFGSTIDGSGALSEAWVVKVQNRKVATE